MHFSQPNLSRVYQGIYFACKANLGVVQEQPVSDFCCHRIVQLEAHIVLSTLLSMDCDGIESIIATQEFSPAHVVAYCVGLALSNHFRIMLISYFLAIIKDPANQDFSKRKGN